MMSHAFEVLQRAVGRVALRLPLMPPWDPRLVVALVLAGCLAVDLTLLAINLFGERPIEPFLRLGRDWRAPTIAEYVKLALAVAMALVAYRLRPVPVHAAWVAAFAIVLADNSLQVHERGAALVVLITSGSSMLLTALEAGIMLVLATVILVILWLGYRATTDDLARRYTRRTFVLLAVLAGLTVGMDLVHVLAPAGTERLLGLVENGGELLLITAILVHATWHAAFLRVAADPEPEALGKAEVAR